jgi:hypothetical protein
MSEQPHTAANEEAARRAAEEAQLATMTSTDMMLQSAVLLLNTGGRRLGLAPPSASPDELAAARADRDLEQVRDSIDAVRALLEILERRLSGELRPLRDALSQLQMAYARELQGVGAAAGAVPGDSAAAQDPAPETAKGGEAPATRAKERTPGDEAAEGEQGERGPGPAESSGRLWVPGR